MSKADVLTLQLSPELISYRESIRSEVQRERIQNAFCIFDSDIEIFCRELDMRTTEMNLLFAPGERFWELTDLDFRTNS